MQVTLQRFVGGKWGAVVSGKTAANGTYRIARAFPRGTWPVRLVAAGGAAQAQGWTGVIRLTVK